MAIPTYDKMMLPLLHQLADGKEHFTRDLAEPMAGYFQLTEEERSAMLPSGQTTYVRHRLGWAGFRLRRAGLASMPARAHSLSQRMDRSFSLPNLPICVRVDLLQFPAWKAFLASSKRTDEPISSETKDSVDSETPEETIDNAYQSLRRQLAAELLLRVKSGDPFFFEKMVVELLVAMGYGGSIPEAGRATKPTGDGGIDGVINEDRLGLDAVYIQAKKWENTVGEPQLRDFVGALHAHRAKKGVFFTTSEFSEPARRYVEKVDFKISLIDGQRLAELMIDFGIGVSQSQTYVLVKIDNDYFAEG